MTGTSASIDARVGGKHSAGEGDRQEAAGEEVGRQETGRLPRRLTLRRMAPAPHLGPTA